MMIFGHIIKTFEVIRLILMMCVQLAGVKAMLAVTYLMSRVLEYFGITDFYGNIVHHCPNVDYRISG